MAASKTSIINKALTLVGALAVTSIDDDSTNARTVRKIYEIDLRSILSECKWNFATKRLLLSISADTLSWYDTGEGVVYVRPSDIIKIFETNNSKARWREEGDYIVSDTSELGIRYVYFHDDPAKYPGLFVDAFVDKLASSFAYEIVNSATLGERYLGKYENISLPKATAANSQVGYQQTIIDDAWELSKYHNNATDA